VVLIDPWKDFPPGNKLFPAGADISDADIILVTHGHLDHLGDTVRLAKEGKPTLKVCSIFEIMIYLLSEGVPQERLQPMNKGGSIVVDGLTITMVDATHSSGIGGFEPKVLVHGGEAAGFVIKLEDGQTLYHAGDTEVFGDMKLIAELYAPTIALLPIGGVFTMGPREAAHAVSLIMPRVAIPMHYGGTFALPGTPEAFAEAVKSKVGDAVRVVSAPAGEGLSF